MTTNKKNTKKIDTSFYNLSGFNDYNQKLNYSPLNTLSLNNSFVPLHSPITTGMNSIINNIDISYNIDNISSNNTSHITYKTNLNFYEQLNNDDDEEENVDRCLISNLPLDQTKIEFKCGHKFNYYYIFKEIFNIKKTNNNVFPNEKLGHINIKCPYCRTTYNQLLPPPFDISDTQELNWINSPNKWCMPIKCNKEICNSKKIYVTPRGYYCKRHYTFLKNDKNIDGSCGKNKSESNNEQEYIFDKVKISNNDTLHPLWKSYTHYKVNELKTILRDKGMKVSGTKAVLISRLLNINVFIFDV